MPVAEPAAELVHYGVDRGVATVTLDSPRNRKTYEYVNGIFG